MDSQFAVYNNYNEGTTFNVLRWLSLLRMYYCNDILLKVNSKHATEIVCVHCNVCNAHLIIFIENAQYEYKILLLLSIQTGCQTTKKI